MRWKKYSKYKDSRFEWLGDIPQGWKVISLRRVFSIVNGSTPKSSESSYWEGDICWVTPDDLGNLIGDTIHETKRNITTEGYESCGTTMVPEGSLILSTRAPIGHLAIASSPICTNQGCKSLVIINNDYTKYFYYQIFSAKQELLSWGQGSTFTELSRDKLANVSLALPSPLEQCAIATFLDRETSLIDTLIVKKERQIELLKEKRTALISHAVTKGLDPNVKMKDSGIEWLGEIPERWEIKVLKRNFKIQNGSTPKSSESEYWEGNILWATPDDLGSLKGDTLIKTRRMITELGYNSCGTSLALEGSLILSTRAPIGHLAIAGKSMCTNQGCHSLVFRSNDNRRYYYYLILSLRKVFESLGQGSTFKELARNKLESICLVAPPLKEQRAIAAFLDMETSRIDRLIEKIQFSIEKLHEYRFVLISAAVTGKIDVREEVEVSA